MPSTSPSVTRVPPHPRRRDLHPLVVILGSAAAYGAALVLRPPPVPALRPAATRPETPPDDRLPGPPEVPPEAVVPRRRDRTRLVVGGLSLAALALRLANPRALWLDELTTVHQAKQSLGEMLHLLWRDDVHPPLHHLVLWADIRLLGDGELAVRLPSTVMGALLVPLVFAVGRDLVDRRTGLIAASLCATAPLAIWYAQEARMYAQFMVLAMVAVWAQTRIVRGSERTGRWWVVLTLADTALVLTHWFALLHVAALHLVFLALVLRRRGGGRGRQLLGPWLVALGIQLLVLAPLVPLALRQLGANQPHGPGLDADRLALTADVAPRPSVYSLITNVEWGLFGYQSAPVTRCLVALWPVALLGMLLLLGRPRRAANRYLLFVAGVPTAVVFGASFLTGHQRSLAEVRYFAGAVPLLFLLVASLITAVLPARRAQLVAGAALVAAMGVGLVGQHLAASERLRPDHHGPTIRLIRSEALTSSCRCRGE